jgi:hypothetical protein
LEAQKARISVLEATVYANIQNVGEGTDSDLLAFLITFDTHTNAQLIHDNSLVVLVIISNTQYKNEH